MNKSKSDEVYLAIIKTVDGKTRACFVLRGGEPSNGWVIASRTPEMDSAIWFWQSSIISIELHPQGG